MGRDALYWCGAKRRSIAPMGRSYKEGGSSSCARRCYSRRISSIAAAGLRSFALLMK